MQDVLGGVQSFRVHVADQLNSRSEAWNRFTSPKFWWDNSKNLIFFASAVVIGCHFFGGKKIFWIRTPKDSLPAVIISFTVIPAVVKVAERIIFKQLWSDKVVRILQSLKSSGGDEEKIQKFLGDAFLDGICCCGSAVVLDSVKYFYTYFQPSHLLSKSWDWKSSLLLTVPISMIRDTADDNLGGKQVVHWASVAFAVYLVAPQIIKAIPKRA